MSPTARSLARLRKRGYHAAVVEHWNSHIKVRQDLWGIADVIAVHPMWREFVLVQATSVSNISSRVNKVKASRNLAPWILAGGRFVVHGWRKLKSGLWDVREVEITLEDE